MGCSSKAFKEPCALLISKNAVPLSPLCASSPLDAQNVVSFSEVSLSLLSLSPPHGLPQRWRAVAGRWRPYLKCCWRRALSNTLTGYLSLYSCCIALHHWSVCSFVMPSLNCGPHSPPLPCCSASCTPSLSGDLGRFASSCCSSSDSFRSRFGGQKLKA